MPRQRAEAGRGRGTKRSASSAIEGHGENTNAQQSAPKRRVQAEFLAPEDIRLRVAQDSLDLRIERTDREDDEDDTTSLSWLATTHNRGVVGHGSTDLIRRQLDQIDALAPDTMLEFVIHPVHERTIPAQPPDDHDETEPEVNVAQHPAPPTDGPPKTPLPRAPSPDQLVPPPLPDHSSGSPEMHWSPECALWPQSWDHLCAEAKKKWAAQYQEPAEPSKPKQSNHRYPTRSIKRDNTPRLIVTIKRVPAQEEVAPGLQAAPEEEEHEDDERRAQENNTPRTRSRRTCTRRGMFKAQPPAEEPEQPEQEDSDPCDSLLDFLRDEDEAQDDQSDDADEDNDGNSGSSDDSSSTDISADSTDDSDDTEKPDPSGRLRQDKHRENPVQPLSAFRSRRARTNQTRYPRRLRRLTRRSPDPLWF